jgi:hypothetical protein
MGIGEYIQQTKQVLRQGMMGQRESFDGAQASSASGDIVSESSSSLIRSLMGSIGNVGDPFFPPDIIGGICPRVAGEEEAIVWNAAVEACDSERVHIAWQAVGNTIWYLAVRSSDLASHTNSWCPLATLLPTAESISGLPVCYTYFGEELAVLMVITAEELHIYRGTAAVIKAKTERTAHELGSKASIVNIDLFHVGQMAPVPWYSASLFEDRARRILSTLSVLASLSIVGVTFLVWLLASMSMISSRHDLSAAIEHTQAKSMKLLQEVEDLRYSPLREQIGKFLSVNDGLLSLNGLLTVYDISDKGTRWRAVVPPNATAESISAMGGKNIDTTEQGAFIGNQAEIDYEATKKEKR